MDQSRRLRYEDIKEGLVNEYRNNGTGLIKRRGGKIQGMDYLDEHFKHMRVSSITTPVLRKLVAALKSGQLAPGRRGGELQQISGLWLSSHGRTETEPLPGF